MAFAARRDHTIVAAVATCSETPLGGGAREIRGGNADRYRVGTSVGPSVARNST